jgi:outer membrane protein TolC
LPALKYPANSVVLALRWCCAAFFGLVAATALITATVRGQCTDTASIDEFQQRIHVAAESDRLERQSLAKIPEVPDGFKPWWQNVTTNQIQAGTNATPVDLETLILRTLEHSAQVKVFSDLPFIRQTAIVEAGAAFDWTQFLRTRWDDTSDPVGNVLTTGGSPRYRNNQWTFEAGVYRRNQIGGRIEVAQELGFQNTNSTFFQPNDQGTSRIRLGYTQPLRRGSGRVYNTSLVVLAKIDAAIAEDEFSRQLQSHLLEVTRAYWSLYLERVVLVQKQKSFLRAKKILDDLSRRPDDVAGSQLIRVEATVTERKSDLVRAEMAVRNAQERVHALVNDPLLATTVNLEMIPMDQPVRQLETLDIGEVLTTALQMRPEVNQSLKEIKAAGVRLGMSRNELLPQLDLTFETYVAGLRGESDLGNAWLDQLRSGEPGYSIGLQYEVPAGNRVAKARLQRRALELRQLQNQFRVTVETLLMETRVAAREVRTSAREFQAKYHAMQAAAKRLETLEERWAALPTRNSTIGLHLDNVLTAQAQLANAEFEFARAETTYNLALMNLKRATGTLLQHEHIEDVFACVDGLPIRILEKAVPPADATMNYQPTDFFEYQQRPVTEMSGENLLPEPNPPTDGAGRSSLLNRAGTSLRFAKHLRHNPDIPPVQLWEPSVIPR